MGMNGPMFMPGMQGMSGQQQLQYQQLLASQARGQQFYPPMNGFQPPAAGMEFRNASPVGAPGFNGSPMMQPAGLGQGMGPAPGAPPMYPYNMYMPQQQQQAAGGGQRRGRVSFELYKMKTNHANSIQR